MTAPGTARSSDAPVPQAGTRTRSGNAMHRTRAALLDAAADCIRTAGARRTTMTDVARRGGVAKATLYNHFRTKDDVLAALVDSRVLALGERCVPVAASDGLAAALALAAATLADDGALRAVAADEPVLLLPLLAPGESRGWAQARTAVVAVLSAAGVAAGPEAVDAVLRWVVGQLLWPATAEQARLGAQLLAALPAAEPGPVTDHAEPVTDHAGPVTGPPVAEPSVEPSALPVVEPVAVPSAPPVAVRSAEPAAVDGPEPGTSTAHPPVPDGFSELAPEEVLEAVVIPSAPSSLDAPPRETSTGGGPGGSG